jgi:hypothetical protein
MKNIGLVRVLEPQMQILNAMSLGKMRSKEGV